MLNYPVVWVAGDADLSGPMQKHVEEYLRRGGTLVVDITAAAKLPRAISGVAPTGRTEVAEQWFPDGATPRFTTPFDVVDVTWKKDARVLAWAKIGDKKAWSELPILIRHEVGAGAVIVSTVPHMLGQDERAHPALPYLMNGLTAGLLPVEVRLANGARPRGEIMYQLNKTNEGYLVTLVSCRGIDKTQTGLARVDRNGVRGRGAAHAARREAGARVHAAARARRRFSEGSPRSALARASGGCAGGVFADEMTHTGFGRHFLAGTASNSRASRSSRMRSGS